MSDMSNTATFAATGTIATFIVPTTGIYYLSADGAEAGASGGDGGFAGGDFSLVQGETLLVAVGLKGGTGSYSTGEGSGPGAGGGGGGSFIVLETGGMDIPLVVAGGGGAFGAGGASIGGNGQGLSGAGFFSNGEGTYSYNPFPNGLDITGAGAQDFANGLAGGGGSYYALGVPEETIIGGSGGFGGGAGNGNGGGGGGYTGGDIGYGGSSYVSPDATDPLFLSGVETGDGAVSIQYPACFVAGTRIATPDGYVAVETLKVGDLVLSARRQRAVPVQWLGSRHVTHTRAPEPAWACPVRIAAGAFGPDQPARDLFLSPDHAVYAAGVLIPVRVLVNDDSVARHPIDTVTYYHVQVDEHDILLADGVQVESYLETDQLSAPGAASRIWEAAGCAPLHVTGSKVEAVRARLAGREVPQTPATARPGKALASLDMGWDHTKG